MTVKCAVRIAPKTCGWCLLLAKVSVMHRISLLLQEGPFWRRGTSASGFDPQKVPFCLQPDRIIININITAHTHTHTHIYTCMCVCVYIYIYIYIYIFLMYRRLIPIYTTLLLFCNLILFKYFCLDEYFILS